MQNRRITKPAFVVLLVQLMLLSVVEAQSPVSLDVAISVPLVADLNMDLNITSPTDDYVRRNQRQYAANIEWMDMRLADFKACYERELDVLTSQQLLLMPKLQEVDNKLYPLEVLDDFHKHCVQKYSWKLATPSSIQLTITNCVQSAINSFSSYSSPPKNYRNTLNNYYNINLVNALNLCKKNNPTQTQNYTNCAIQAIAQADTTTATNLKNFITQMQSSQCSAEGRIRTAVDCSFTAVYNSLSNAAEVTGLVDSCISDLELCPKCDPVKDDPIPETICPNQMSLSLDAADYQNDTIKNPFYGYSSNTSCVLVNLQHPV